MSIVSVKRLDTHQTGPQLSADWTRQWNDTYVVVTTPGTSGATVRTAPGVPQMHSAHPNDSAALVTRVGPDQQSDTVWYVRVGWTTSPSETNQGNDPLDDPVKARWTSVHYEETRYADYSDPPKAFVDAAGTPLVPPPKFPVSHLKLILTQNETSYNPAVALEYANKVNSDDFWGQPAGTVKCDLPLASEQARGDQSYWQVVYGFEFKPEGWNPVFALNEGPRYYEDILVPTFPGPFYHVEKTLKVAADGVGVSHNGQVLLALDGYKLADGAQTTVLEFTMYDEIAFAPLNLDLD